MPLPNYCLLAEGETATFSAGNQILIKRRQIGDGVFAHFGEFKLAENYAVNPNVTLPQWMVDGIASEAPTEG